MMPLMMKKPFRDIRKHKAKTLFILLSISISLTIAGTILHTKLQFEAALQESMEKSNAADASFYTNSFKDIPKELAELEGLEKAEPRISLRARAKTEDGYKNIEVTGLPDKDRLQIGKINIAKDEKSDSGVYAEASTKNEYIWREGEEIKLLIPGEKQKSMQLSGSVSDPSRIPAGFTGTGYVYLTKDALKKLGVPLAYTQIQVRFEDGTSKKERDQLISRINKILKSSDITSYRTEQSEETFYIRNTLASSILTVLILFGLCSLVLGFILIIHLFHRVIAEQVKELGIQRVVGASASFIWRQYIVYLGLIGTLSFLLSAAGTYYGSKWAVRYLAEELNIGSYTESIDLNTVYLLAGFSLAIPFFGAFWPVLNVLNKPLTDSLRNVPHSFPSKEKKGAVWFSLSLLSWRHARSRKAQVLSNILMLSFGGAIILSCLTLHQTLTNQLQQMNHFWNYDQEWSVKSDLPKEELIGLFEKTEGVSEAEGWTVRNTEVLSKDRGRQNALLMSLPEQSKLIRPAVQEGQWLSKVGKPAIVINEDLRTLLENPKAGETVKLKIGREEKAFTIKGIISSQLKGPAAYMSSNDYEQWLSSNAANRVAVKMKSGADLTEASDLLEKRLAAGNVSVEGSETIQAMKKRPEQIIGLVVSSILAAGFLFTLLGMMNLMTAASMNVYERQKEIGITRAIGGSSGKIFRMYAGESIIVSIVSWGLAGVISLPLSQFLSTRIGLSLLGSPLQNEIYPQGIAGWLIASVTIGLLSAAIPVVKSLRKPLPIMLED
ncbi:FtsX-like permease family protein [Metabacillus sp. 113a]|uniref:ABC transporter permease n=1 Tax=Metabacillus sp. 113a TaxID=3404706 RepID=UPI003CF255C0